MFQLFDMCRYGSLPAEGTCILPGNMPITGGAIMTITGGNFGGKDFGSRITLGSTACQSQEFITWTSIMCKSYTAGIGAENIIGFEPRMTMVRRAFPEAPCAMPVPYRFKCEEP